MLKSKIKLGDKIIVLSGNYKKNIGEVIRVYPKKMKILVKGINIKKKHIKSKNNEQGKIIKKEFPIHISNVSIIDPKYNLPSKILLKIKNNIKIRIYKKSKNIIYNNIIYKKKLL